MSLVERAPEPLPPLLSTRSPQVFNARKQQQQGFSTRAGVAEGIALSRDPQGPAWRRLGVSLQPGVELFPAGEGAKGWKRDACECSEVILEVLPVPIEQDVGDIQSRKESLGEFG
ncbi:hypothetical protein [Cystobacter ferrugineus]|uniref:hypothetical protein n=1 Tax=Cystobacter ferrugineus TaxID=83449 RepID=UPI00116107EA|nr:hypothetical protein [Cystobacter ferrugineus]